MEYSAIKTIITDILNYLEVSYSDVEITADETGTVFMIRTNEARHLIGYRGATLSAINYIVKRIVEKKGANEDIRFSVDVNEYQKETNDQLRIRARILADRVRSLSSKTELEPMSSYERMIIHTTLEPLSDIHTESIGKGKERRVVISHKQENDE
jgi:spoIIIJ-associated protein